MKIVFCVEFYFPSVGGAQEVVRQLAERMVRLGHQVSVLTSALSSRVSRFHNGVEIIGFEVSGNHVRGIAGAVENYQSHLRELQADAICIYAAQQWTFDAAWLVLDEIRARKFLVPCGYSGLQDSAYVSYFKQLPEILEKFDGVIYHANSYRDREFADSHGLRNSYWIPNGVDLEEFEVAGNACVRAEFGVSESTFVFLTVGTLTGTKGHAELAEAYSLADFGGRNTLLILNGNKPVRSFTRKNLFGYVRTLVGEYGVWYASRHIVRVILTRIGSRMGQVDSLERWLTEIKRKGGSNKRAVVVDLPRNKLVQAFKQANLFVFASNIEYSPLVLFEAAAAGLPFLTVPVGNSREIVAWTRGGEICEAPIDSRGFTRVKPAELARRMEDLSRDSERLVALGRAGRDSVRAQFNWDFIAESYLDLFVAKSAGEGLKSGSDNLKRAAQ